MTQVHCEIAYITKNPRQDPFNPILEVGGPAAGAIWRCSLETAIHHAENYGYVYYVRRGLGQTTRVELQRGRSGRLHLQTVPDSTTSNNLLHLRPFPSNPLIRFLDGPSGIIQTHPRGLVPQLS